MRCAGLAGYGGWTLNSQEWVLVGMGAINMLSSNQQGQGGLVEAGARGGEEPLYQFPSWTN